MSVNSATVRTLVIPKHGHTNEECEDSYFVIPTGSLREPCSGPLVAVISDGASESMFARTWSGMIAWRAARGSYRVPDTLTGPGASFRHCITQLTGRWKNWVSSYIEQRVSEGRPLQWYEEAKLASGAFATLLALRLDYGCAMQVHEGEQGGFWNAAALGDSCVFQIRGQQVISHFPIKSSADFGISPSLLGSNANPDLVCRRTLFDNGPFKEGDEFFLMTDALAAWFLSAVENSSPSEFEGVLDQLRVFSRTGNRSKFATWLSSLRVAGVLRNDDITFMYICTSGRSGDGNS